MRGLTDFFAVFSSISLLFFSSSFAVLLFCSVSLLLQFFSILVYFVLARSPPLAAPPLHPIMVVVHKIVTTRLFSWSSTR